MTLSELQQLRHFEANGWHARRRSLAESPVKWGVLPAIGVRPNEVRQCNRLGVFVGISLAVWLAAGDASVLGDESVNTVTWNATKTLPAETFAGDEGYVTWCLAEAQNSLGLTAWPVGEVPGNDRSQAAGSLRTWVLKGSFLQPLEGDGWWCVGKWSSMPQPPLVILTDGSVLPIRDPLGRGSRYDPGRQRLTIDHQFLGEVSLPWSAIRHVVWSWPVDEDSEGTYSRNLIRQPMTKSAITLKTKGRLPGSLRSLSADAIGWIYQGVETTLDLDDVSTVSLSRTFRSGEREVTAWLFGRDGSRLALAKASLSGPRLTLLLQGGLTLNVASVQEFLGQLEAVRFAPAGGLLLSRCEPVMAAATPWLRREFPIQIDANAHGAWLRDAGGFYDDGIAMQAPARIEFALDAPYRRFTSRVVLEPAVTMGCVDFQVWRQTTGPEAWELLTSSGMHEAAAGTAVLTCELQGVRRIALQVVPGPRGFVQARALWLEPRCVP